MGRKLWWDTVAIEMEIRFRNPYGEVSMKEMTPRERKCVSEQLSEMIAELARQELDAQAERADVAEAECERLRARVRELEATIEEHCL